MKFTKQEKAIFDTAIAILAPIGLGINLSLTMGNPMYVVLLFICILGTVAAVKFVYESRMKLPEEEDKEE